MFHRNATQVGFKLFQMRFEAKGEQQRGQRVTLVNSVRGGEPLAIAFVIPEKLKRERLWENIVAQGAISGMAASSFRRQDCLSAEEKALRASNARRTRSGSDSERTRAVCARHSVPAGTPTANWVPPSKEPMLSLQA